jgi:AbiU2
LRVENAVVVRHISAALYVKMNTIIKEYLGNLRYSLDVASINYDIWWTYKQFRTRKYYLDTMNNFLGFFSNSIYAHFLATIIPCYRILETRKDTINIGNLIKEINSDKLFETNLLDEIQTRLSKLRPIWTKIGIIRHEIYAHKSNVFSAEESFKKAKIKPKEIRYFIDNTYKLVNYIFKKLNEPSSHILRDKKTTLQILRILKRSQMLENV